jgi:tetratricopeptide (TPR) repeat protein
VRAITLSGHATTHKLQPLQRSVSTTIAPLIFAIIYVLYLLIVHILVVEVQDVHSHLIGMLCRAYRKQGNWQQALNNYQYAIDLNPESPAQHAYQMAMDILNFYNKDMYNQ